MEVVTYFFGFASAASLIVLTIVSLRGHHYAGLWLGVAAWITAGLSGGCWLHDFWSKQDAKASTPPPPVKKPTAAYGADLMTTEVRERFSAALMKCPRNSVGIVRVSQTTESGEFADVIEELLRSTQRLGGRMFTKAGSMIPHPAGRVLITGWKAAESQDEVNEIAGVLRDAGIEGVYTDPYPVRKGQAVHAGNFIQILIKPK